MLQVGLFTCYLFMVVIRVREETFIRILTLAFLLILTVHECLGFYEFECMNIN